MSVKSIHWLLALPHDPGLYSIHLHGVSQLSFPGDLMPSFWPMKAPCMDVIWTYMQEKYAQKKRVLVHKWFPDMRDRQEDHKYNQPRLYKKPVPKKNPWSWRDGSGVKEH